MIRFASLFLALVLWADVAVAQGRVRTGEHGEYTRVVIPIGSDRGFALEGDGRTRRVVFDPPGTYDTTRALAPLNAQRVIGIESAEGALALDLACNCDILAYRYESRFLVLDIYNAPENGEADATEEDPTNEELAATTPGAPIPLDAPTIERALANQRPYRPGAALALDLLQASLGPVPRLTPLESAVDRRPVVDVGMGDDVEDASTSSMLDDTFSTNAPEPGDMPNASADLEMDEEPAGLIDAADTLAQQLARAAAAGLLETAARQPMSIADQPDAPAEPPTEAPEDMVEGDPEPTGLPVRAANAFDVAGNRDSGLAAIAAALSCAQPIGDISNWSDGLGFDQQLGALRQASFDSNGVLLRAPTIDLARYYIYHGFGAEAEAWLLQLEDPPETELSMARYLDDRPGPNFPPVETLALCSGLDLLWRFVDAPEFPELALSQRQEMRLAFSGLPLGLRRLLGPDFVRKLASEGYDDDAADVREALARGPTLDDAEVLVLEMETTDDRPTRSETETLEARLQTAGPDTARVMREYLAARRQASDPPEEDRLIAAEALLRETDPEMTPGSLWHEVLLAHTAMGDMDRAFPMLDALVGVSPETQSEISESVVDLLLANRKDAALIVMATRLTENGGAAGLPRDMRAAIFDRLTYFGLDDLAAPFLETGASEPPPADRTREPDGPSAQVARRLADLEAGDMRNPESPDDMRAALEDSRALREELSTLLNGAADN